MKKTGFTLIELVIVIVILGILAVVAAPRFLNLQTDSRVSALNGLKGALRETNDLIYGKSVILGTETLDDDGYFAWLIQQVADGNDEFKTSPITHYGYFSVSAQGNLGRVLEDDSDWKEVRASEADAPSFALGGDASDSFFIYPVNAELTVHCYVEYRQASETETPKYLTVTDDC